MRSLDCIGGGPFHRQQVPGSRWCRSLTLRTAARQTDCSHTPDVSFFRYFILANRQRRRYDGPVARITRVSGEVKILFSHGYSLKKKNYKHDANVPRFGRLVTIALTCVAMGLSGR